ncbi:MAG: C_GCAxxG_C_C family protein [Candidatus Latescibacteria bacterium]|nr:C_GCAxxG_C_C family protein [Candidatus Latescibacterota bacterium]
MKHSETLCSRRTFLAVSSSIAAGNCIIRGTSPVRAQEKISTSEKKKQELSDTGYKLGFDYLSNGKYPGCALCTIAAIQDTLNIRDDTIFKAATGMSGGGGGTRIGNCGSYTGCSLVIGQLCGCDRPQQSYKDDYQKASGVVKKVSDEFVSEYGSVICREIKIIVDDRYDYAKNNEGITQKLKTEALGKCSTVVAKGAQWAVELILDEGLVKI